MPVSIGAGAQASFEEPLKLMQDCHRRIEDFLEVLVRVAAPAAGGVLDDERRRGLEVALRYFHEGAPRHTQDEEESLFPRLRDSSAEGAQAALKLVGALEADHERATKLHAIVEEYGNKWLRDGQLPAGELQQLREHLQALQALYRDHIRVEEEEVFPLASKALTAEDLATIGREMKTRRE